jgi:hypothetical protein
MGGVAGAGFDEGVVAPRVAEELAGPAHVEVNLAFDSGEGWGTEVAGENSREP